MLAVQPSELKQMTPGEAAEMLRRIEEHGNDVIKAQATAENTRFEALMRALGELGTAITRMHETIAKRPTL